MNLLPKRKSYVDKITPKLKTLHKVHSFTENIPPQPLTEEEVQNKQKKDIERLTWINRQLKYKLGLAPLTMEKPKLSLLKDKFDKDKFYGEMQGEYLINELQNCQQIAQNIGTRLPKLKPPRPPQKARRKKQKTQDNQTDNKRQTSIDAVIRKCENEMKKSKRFDRQLKKNSKRVSFNIDEKQFCQNVKIYQQRYES